MTLAEFMKKRREELGLSWNDIIDGGIANNTWCNIVNGKQLTVKPATMEKLARLLDCTKGDLQACMAETPNPLRKEAEKPEGQAGASITTKAGKNKKDEVDKLMREKPFTPAPDPEEPALAFRAEPDVDIMFPVEEPAEEPEETLEEFKQRLRMMCLKEMTTADTYEPSAQVFMHIGKRLVEELVK